MTEEEYAQLLQQHVDLLKTVAATLDRIQTIELLLALFALIAAIGIAAICLLAAYSVARVTEVIEARTSELHHQWSTAQHEMNQTLQFIAKNAVRAARESDGPG